MASRIDDLRQQLKQALVDEGVMDEATADAVLLPARAAQPDLVGNLADLQRMGSVALQDRIPTPPGEEDEQTSDIQAAFKEPDLSTPEDDPGFQDANRGALEGAMQTEVVPPTVEGEARGGTEGAAPEDSGGTAGLESMTKAELIDEANRRGVEINSGDTKADIIAKLGG